MPYEVDEPKTGAYLTLKRSCPLKLDLLSPLKRHPLSLDAKVKIEEFRKIKTLSKVWYDPPLTTSALAPTYTPLSSGH